MFEVMIGKDVAYLAKQGGGTISNANEVDLLAAGAFAVFHTDHAHTLIDVTGSNVIANTDFYFAVGVSTNNPAGGVTVRRSRVIPYNCPTLVKKSYDAPAKKVMSLTCTALPATLVVGTIASVKIFITEEPADDAPLFGKGSSYNPAVRQVRADVTVTSSHTQDTLIAAVAAALNAAENNDFVAVTVTGTYAGADLKLVFTADNYYQEFDIAADNLLEGETVATSTPIDFGHGTVAQITELEELANIENGNDARVMHASKFWKQPSQVTAGETYATWEFSWEETGDQVIGIDGKARHRLVIAVGDADTIETNITAILAAITTLTTIDGDNW